MEVFEVRFNSRLRFQVCLGSKGEARVDRTVGIDACSTRAVRPPLGFVAPGEPLAAWPEAGGEIIPPAGTRGEVGNGVSDEPSGSPVRRICVEQAGEGRGVWRRSGKSTHQTKRLACSSKARSQTKVKLSCYSLIYFTCSCRPQRGRSSWLRPARDQEGLGRSAATPHRAQRSQSSRRNARRHGPSPEAAELSARA